MELASQVTCMEFKLYEHVQQLVEFSLRKFNGLNTVWHFYIPRLYQLSLGFRERRHCEISSLMCFIYQSKFINNNPRHFPPNMNHSRTG